MSELSDSFKEAVCVEVPRIFDTCSDRDCIVDLPIVLNNPSDFTSDITNVKTTCVQVTDISITVDELQFKRGYFSVDMTFTFSCEINGYTQANPTVAVPLTGTATWNKKVILYGSQGNIQTFSSDGTPSQGVVGDACEIISLPKASVSVVEPIALDTKIASILSGNNILTRGIVITIGLFSIVQLSRPVALLIPTYDYCVPKHECCLGGGGTNSETACEVFEKISFPLEQFFPQPTSDYDPRKCCKPD